jgi:hypothetical protein
MFINIIFISLSYTTKRIIVIDLVTKPLSIVSKTFKNKCIYMTGVIFKYTLIVSGPVKYFDIIIGVMTFTIIIYEFISITSLYIAIYIDWTILKRIT